MDPADALLSSLPFFWEDCGVTRDIFLEDPGFLGMLATFWKWEPDFAKELAFYWWKFYLSPAGAGPLTTSQLMPHLQFPVVLAPVKLALFWPVFLLAWVKLTLPLSCV